MNEARLTPDRLTSGDLKEMFRLGWLLFQTTRGPSLAYAATAFAIGLMLLTGIAQFGLSPLSLPLAGGFTGAYLGMYASSNGTPSNNTADFDWFEYLGK